MKEKSKIVNLERKSLRYAMIANVVMGVAGVYVWHLSNADAMLLDGVFSFVNFMAAYIASKIATETEKRPDSNYPYGRSGMEGVYVLFRSMVIIGLISISFLGAASSLFAYFTTGVADPVNLGPLLYYAVVMVFITASIVLYHRHNNAKMNNQSEVLEVEAKASIVDGAMSAVAGIGLVLVSMLPNETFMTNSFFDIRLIADKIMVVILVAILISTPWTIFKKQLQRFMGKRVDSDLEYKLKKIIEKYLEQEELTANFFLIDIYTTRSGKENISSIHLAYTGQKTVKELDKIRVEAKNILNEKITNCSAFITFSNKKIN